MGYEPIEFALTIYQGATLRQEWRLRAGPDERRAQPVDLTGCQARMQVRPRLEDAQVLLELTTENGGIELGGTSGQITLHASAQATAALDFRRGVYDLELVRPNGDVQRLFYGPVRLSREVTR